MALLTALSPRRFLTDAGAKQKALWAAAASLLFLSALGVRVFTFWLPHWQGDQSQYVTLAMKLDERGMEGFNLAQVEIRRIIFEKYRDWHFVFPVFSPEKKAGDFFRAYKMLGLDWNNLPLYYKSPLFAATLRRSHQWFAGRQSPYVVVKTPVDDLKRKPPFFEPLFFMTQFWAASVPLASNLVVLVLTLVFGTRLFGPRIGLLALFLMSLHPTGIVTSYKLLSDDFVSMFVIASLLAFHVAYKKRSVPGAFLSGLLAGLAVLAKQSALLLPVCAGCFLFFEAWSRERLKGLWSAVSSPLFWAFTAGLVFISAHWFLRVYEVYGTPFYQPSPERMFRDDVVGWFRLVLARRPDVIYLFVANLPLLCPPYLFGHFTFLDWVRGLRGGLSEPRLREAVFFLWAWILPFFVFFISRVESREERYLLPVYPALAMLSAWGLDRFRLFLAARGLGSRRATLAVGLFLAASALWSLPISLETVFDQRFLILRPWRDWVHFFELWWLP